LTDDFLFSLGLSYATVRCNPTATGVADLTRPWSDGVEPAADAIIRRAIRSDVGK